MKLSALIAPKISAMKNLVKKPLAELPHLRGLPLAHPISNANSFDISVLIGADRSWDFIGKEVIEGPGPYAVKSKFGYLLSGPSVIESYPNSSATILHIATNTFEEEAKLQNYWDLETIGIKDDTHSIDKVSEFELFRDTNL